MRNIQGNRLNTETSSYLLSHSNQAVDWFPWGDEAFNKARIENKLLYISIGYSSCYWCIDMLRDCFEDHQMSKILNEHYVSIIIDKEERPDLDQFYTDAVHLMADNVGWPLSCFALPNGIPVFGGVYFSSDRFLEVTTNLNKTYKDNPLFFKHLGDGLTSSLNQVYRLKEKKPILKFSVADVLLIIEPWRRKFDLNYGGQLSAPKFPLPCSTLFLLSAGYYTGDMALTQQADTTLTALANGGIHDQLEGGFFHYAVDMRWEVPNFEKILYDNGLLVSLYAVAYRRNGAALYKKIALETLDFIQRKLSSPDGLYYGSISSESEGVNGNYYTWTTEELLAVAEDDAALLWDHWGIKEKGNVKGRHVPFVAMEIAQLAQKYMISEQEVSDKIAYVKEKMNWILKERTHPFIDPKVLTSWNAIVIQAFLEAFTTFDLPEYLQKAVIVADYIVANLIDDNHHLVRLKTAKGSIGGFLDDYAFTCYAFLLLYQATSNLLYLEKAIGLANYVMDHFYDEKSGMFFFAEEGRGAPLRTMDIIDKAMPSSNAKLSMCLTLLTAITGDVVYRDKAIQMVSNLKLQAAGSGPYIAYWANILLLYVFEPVIAFTTPDKTVALYTETGRKFIPNLFIVPMTTMCKENAGKSKNGFYYYFVDLSGNDQENEMEYQRLFQYAENKKRELTEYNELNCSTH